MNITFIGTGYVGLVTGVMMASLGNQVNCIDLDQNKIRQLEKKVCPIYEPELEAYLEKYSDNLLFADEYGDFIKSSKVIFITVGTPEQDDGSADLRYIFSAVDDLIPFISQDSVVVIKSTVPPGTCRKVQDYFDSKGVGVFIASNPEFLREGSAVYDFLNPDRIVIGTTSPYATKVLEDLYQPFTDQNIPIVTTNLETSELIKYGANAFLATKIAFINEIANLCQHIRADTSVAAHAISLDKRIGSSFFNPGPGFGGSCFPKDILALSKVASDSKIELKVLDSVIKSNKQRKFDMVDKIIQILGQKKNLGILGVTYKADTDDVRSSPAMDIIEILNDRGFYLKIYDPAGMANASDILNSESISYVDNALESSTNVDALVILTEWKEFKDLPWEIVKQNLRQPVIIDLRNILDYSLLRSKGFEYYCL